MSLCLWDSTDSVVSWMLFQVSPCGFCVLVLKNQKQKKTKKVCQEKHLLKLLKRIFPFDNYKFSVISKYNPF